MNNFMLKDLKKNIFFKNLNYTINKCNLNLCMCEHRKYFKGKSSLKPNNLQQKILLKKRVLGEKCYFGLFFFYVNFHTYLS